MPGFDILEASSIYLLSSTKGYIWEIHSINAKFDDHSVLF